MNVTRAMGTVLYVEDDENDLLFMRVAFQRAGLAEGLQTVGNGQEAIDYLSGRGAYADRDRHPLPAVVLLDLNLPRVSGFEVLQWLREQTELRTLPVVVFSSSTRPEDKLRATELGANEYLEKPRSGSRFVEVVERLRDKWLSAVGATSL